jgi:outer membrane protein assembly factor BamB
MDSTPETERWVVCPVCHKANPPGRLFCQHCWGAVLRTDIPLSAEQVEQMNKRRQSYLVRRKAVKIMAITLASLIALAAMAYPILYYFTDVIFAPPKGLSSTSPPEEWTMFRHDLGHSGTAGSTDSLPQGKVKWVFTAGGPIHSSPAIAHGNVYFGSRDFKLYALDADTGVKRWEYETNGWVESSPAITDGVVYVGSNDSHLYAIDTQNGMKQWDFKAGYPVISSPAVAGGIVYFGADDYFLYALDATEGTKLWDFNTKGVALSSPAVADGIVYIGSSHGFSYALHGLDGKLRLRIKTRYPVFSAPAVDDGTVYFITDNGDLYAMDGRARSWPQEHEIRPHWLQVHVMGFPVPPPPAQSGYLWGIRLGSATSSPVVIGDTLYLGSENKLIALDLKSQQKRWEFVADGTIRSSPAVTENMIIFGTERGWLYAVDVNSGEKLWELDLGAKITSSPAVVNGIIYIGSHEGNLYAIE